MQNRTMRLLVLLVAPLVAASFVGAEIIDDDTPVPPAGAIGGPETTLTGPDLEMWKRGRKLFDRDWRLADGLGTPDMNADSCRGCHQSHIIGGAGLVDVNVYRFGDDNNGNGPFQDLPGGQVASRLRRQGETPPREEGHEAADVFEQRQTPLLFGFGAIDTISDATIQANADPLDNFPPGGDGIRGVARMIQVGGPTGPFEVGKFGWKAQIPRAADFVRDALGGEVGITIPDDGRGFGMLTDADGVADPEISLAEFDDLVFFTTNLCPPPRAGGTDPAVAAGEVLFDTIGCANCHIPSLPGSSGPVPLYSDLLVHEVHPPTFRGMAEPDAPVGAYRTAPLWGLRVTGPYLHDGSATTIEAAVLRHDAEALEARQAFEALSPADRDAVLQFLSDL